MDLDLDHALETIKAAARAGGREALSHFRTGVHIERKADRSPVTEADRAAEDAIFSVLRREFPDAGILGEESGEHRGNAPFRFIVDPIDGTRGFTRGGRFWGSLVALEHGPDVLAGAMYLPALDDLYWAARDRGAFINGDRLQVRPSPSLDDTTLSLGELKPLFAPPLGTAIEGLIRDVENARCYGDLMGVGLVLTGVADAWLEAGVKPWDIAPSRILAEEAGARFTSFAGTADIHHGTALVASPELHAEILARLRGH